jgi:signal transduction histidine kinase/DNA-binding LytR/AlgR family response regulator
MEFKRAHLYDVNPVGVGAMIVASVLSVAAFYGLFGVVMKALAPFVALGAALITAPIIAYATGGKYYIARKPKRSWHNLETIKCCICEHAFEPEDMASCPAYSGPICSLCCSLDARCHDLCKPHARISAQLSGAAAAVLPAPVFVRLNSQVSRYLGVFAAAAGLVGLTLGLIYLQSSVELLTRTVELSDVLWKIFFALIIIIGVVAWLFVLAQQSRRAAEDETRRQTTLLIQEIDAHKRTDAELQRAKEVAESANLAKSRYVVGLSHELRSPLNAISGYAQLLEQDSTIEPKPRDQVRVVRRSADHLSGLIDGILDISKIEAGRLYLSRDEVHFNEFLDQLVGMFRLQSQAKGIAFDFKRPEVLPPIVYADEKRLRQVLINLLSNAIKFTDSGSVKFIVHYRSPVAEFEIIDTGPGIPESDLERIFAPFERGITHVAQPQTGTGLGLTISKLLAGVMGGDIQVTSTLGEGSAFRLKILLSEVINPTRQAPVAAKITGYDGPRKTILITDDDPVHRDLLQQILSPLGFILLSATNGEECLALAEHCQPDLFILDISMPQMDGWSLAQALREAGQHKARILMLSASALEVHGQSLAKTYHDGYVMKPIDIPRVLQTVGQLLRIDWLHETDASTTIEPAVSESFCLPPEYLDELIQLGQIGHVKAIQRKLDEILDQHPDFKPFVSHARALVDRFDLHQFMTTLKALRVHEH